MKISNYRRFLGKTQKDMAKILGISTQAYWNKENERTPFTDNEKRTIKELIEPYFPDVTYGELFFNEEVTKVTRREVE